jgi:hypothetical protein
MDCPDHTDAISVIADQTADLDGRRFHMSEPLPAPLPAKPLPSRIIS